MEIPQFHGAWPALITPQSYDLGVNQGMLRDVTAYLLDKGIGGLYLCGSGSHPGGGITCAPGALAAAAILSK